MIRDGRWHAAKPRPHRYSGILDQQAAKRGGWVLSPYVASNQEMLFEDVHGNEFWACHQRAPDQWSPYESTQDGARRIHDVEGRPRVQLADEARVTWEVLEDGTRRIHEATSSDGTVRRWNWHGPDSPDIEEVPPPSAPAVRI